MTSIRKAVIIPEDHWLHIDLELPSDLPAGEAEITVLVSHAGKPNKAKAIECLRQLALLGGVGPIPDPSAWQRDMRRDRPLPGRE